MELAEVNPMAQGDVMSRLVFSLCVGAWTTSLMWVVSRQPWAGVFALGVSLGWVLMGYWLEMEESSERREEVVELEKQVVSLRASMSRMVQVDAALEGERRRASFRSRRLSLSEPALRRVVS